MEALQKKLYTESEYLELERVSPTKSEFYRGELFAMAGASLIHNTLVSNIIFSFMSQLQNKPCSVYPSDLRLRVNKSGLYTYPDVSIICGNPILAPNTSDTVTNPAVLIEVLSDSTEKYDRGQKFQFYREIESLQEYVLVSSTHKRVEVFRKMLDRNWLLLDSIETDSITLESVGCTVRMDDLYKGITFTEEVNLGEGI
jgi:Uma2 family endonuclease